MYYIKLPSGEIIEADNRSMEETENQATILTFTLLINSPHFNDFEEFVTKIQAFHEDEKVFEGRVISVKPSMNDSGVFANDIICESELNYLNDVKVGKWDIHPNDYTPEPSTITELDAYEIYTNMGVVKFLTMLLNNHNAKVLADKRILLGSVTVDDTVYCTTDRETTLNVIQDKLIGTKGGYLRLRKVEGVNHLDYLVTPPELSNNIIELAINMKNISRQNDWHIYTRLIPLGKDGLKIGAINGGLDYVEDTTLKAKYGVIETVEKFDNITIADNLKTKAIEKLAELNQKNYAIECGALELSGISGIDTIYQDFKISQYCRLKNSVLNIDELHRIVSKTTNLDNEWDISLKFSNKIIQSTKIATKTEQKLNNLSASVSLLKSEVNSKTSETKVTNIVEQASTLKVTDSTTNGNILVNDNEIQVYSHPTSHPPSMISQDGNNRFVSDSEKANWNGKLDKTGGILSGDLKLESDKSYYLKDLDGVFRSVLFRNDLDKTVVGNGYHGVAINIPNSTSVEVYNVAANAYQKIYHEGNKPRVVDLPVDYSFTKSFAIPNANEWVDTGIYGGDLATGTYVVAVANGDSGTTAMWDERASGIMSWMGANTNSGDANEIILHQTGHASNGRIMRLRTLTHGGGYETLQITCNVALGASSYTFQFKRMI